MKNPKKFGIYGQGNPFFIQCLELADEMPIPIPATKSELRLHAKAFFYFLKNVILMEAYSKKALLMAYQKSIIESHQLKTVVTFLDTQENFYWLARLVPQVRFIAVQNGLRLGSFSKIFENSNYSTHAKYFCFSDADKNYLEKTPIQFSEISVVGSALSDYHESKITPQKKEFDVCILSQWRRVLFENGEGGDYTTEGLADGFKLLLGHLQAFQKKHPISIVIAGASVDDDREVSYFNTHLGPNFKFFYRDHQPLHAYTLMKKSEVQVGLNSTCLYEAFGQNQKVLFCDFFDYEDQHYPETSDRVWRISKMEKDFDAFSRKLEAVLEMPKDEYKDLSLGSARRVMHFSKQHPAHKALRNAIVF